MTVYFVPDAGFRLPARNPFSADGTYGDGWAVLRLVTTAEFEMKTALEGAFTFTLSTNCPGWPYRLMDFVAYQSEYGADLIVMCSQARYAEAAAAYGDHSIRDRALRDYEPTVLVHSATPEAYAGILADGGLWSWRALKARGHLAEDEPMGRLLGDPPGFSDFVMLGSGVSGEIVVSSRQKGHICMAQDCAYRPGARLYVDAAALARDGLLLRDGAHYKVETWLPLAYVIFSATPKIVYGASLPEAITPADFAGRADALFARRYPAYV
jgi:hypothetical protein